jgi:glutamate/aspartate transport system substrate-binding protein
MRGAVFLSTLLLGAGLLFGSVGGQAQEAPRASAGTLEKIRANGAIYVGYREAAIPFSYVAAGGQAVGYSWELCGHLTEAIKTRLALPNLAVVPVPVTVSSRQMLLEAGTIDLECGSTSNTEQRQRYVAFGVTTFVAGVKVVVRKDAGIRALADMKGKVVVSAAGTGSENYIKSAAARQGLALAYRLGRDHADALRQVVRGEADVLVLDDVVLQGLLMNAPEAERARLVVLDENFGFEPYAIMFRHNDPAFKQLVDATLIGLMQRGELEKIYAKWFTSPIPPKGGNLQLPMSQLLKQLILTPNDKGV